MKYFYTIVLSSLFICFYFNSCSSDESINEETKYDLSRFADLALGANRVALQINGKPLSIDSCKVESGPDNSYFLKILDENNKVFLTVNINKNSNSQDGDSIFAIYYLDYRTGSDTILISHNPIKNTAVRSYGYRTKKIADYDSYSYDSLYLDVVFQIKLDTEKSKDIIKGQLHFNDTIQTAEWIGGL